MSASTSSAVLREIQTLFTSGTASGLTDRQLLERFSRRRDPSGDAAFATMVERHGPMVLRVCRNVLGESSNAEDAFQATFLVLVRRRNSIRGLDSLGGWLYGVACRVAARVRVDAARRRASEQRAALRVVEAVDPSDIGESEQSGRGAVVQEEVRRLPEKYRAVVVLCYWQGLTQEQAAAQIGCPLGTVRSRLARGRDLLRRRLTRRGLASVAGLVSPVLENSDASALALRQLPVPTTLVHSTVRIGARVIAGEATARVASKVVSSLVQRVLWSMTMSKFSSVVCCATLVALIGSGAAVAVSRAQVQGARSHGKGARAKAARLGLSEVSASSTRVHSIIRGQTTIIQIAADGATVKKGEIVCTLDSARLRDSLINQRITVKAAEANFENAKLGRETAEHALTDYMDDLLPREEREIRGEVKVAEAELALVEEQLKANAKAGTKNSLEDKRDALAIARAKVAVEKTANRLHILARYTKQTRIKDLQSEVEKSRSDELAKQALWELENGKAKTLESQIAACEIPAPRDGILVYANPPSGDPLIELGATVRERQSLFQIFSPAEVKAEAE